MRAQIVLSTWNGAAHLGEQLDSLVAQSVFNECEIIIRDDGSSDATLDIVRAFAAEHSNVTVVEGHNLGVIASFGELLKLADETADVFLFCDQDDVWLPDKVAAAVDALRGVASSREPQGTSNTETLVEVPAATDALRGHRFTGSPHGTSTETLVEVPARSAGLETSNQGSSTPALYASRSIVTDANLNPIGETNAHLQGPSFRHALVQTLAPGHTMAFNAALLKLARDNYPASELIMHDSWLYTIAAGLGVVIFDRNTHCLYRTHGANTLGYDVGGFAQITARARRIFGRDRSAYTRQIVAFIDAFGDQLDVDDRAAATGFAFSQRTLANRVAYLRAFPIVHETKMSSLVASALYLAGRYQAPRSRPA